MSQSVAYVKCEKRDVKWRYVSDTQPLTPLY